MAEGCKVLQNRQQLCRRSLAEEVFSVAFSFLTMLHLKMLPNLPTLWRFSRENRGEYSVRAGIQYHFGIVNFTDSSWRGVEVKQQTPLVAVFSLIAEQPSEPMH